MFIPNHFKNENLEEVRAFIKENSFGILITSSSNKILGTHIPLELEDDQNGNEVIYGHVSKANSQWKSFENNEEVMLIFNGPHAYVSSSWYDHENVPTWNYIAIHVYGKMQILEENELLYALNKLVDKYESGMENPVRVPDLSDETMKQMKGIIGFKVTISEIQAAYKLSQNRNREDYNEIVGKLNDSDHSIAKEVSEIMKKKN